MYEDMSLEVVKGISEERHFHPEIEIIFLIEGQAKVNIKDMTYCLEKEDIILINSGVMHDLKCEEYAIAGIVRFSYSVVTGVLENGNAVFLCNSVADSKRSYKEPRNIFHNLVYQYIRQSHKTLCRQHSLMFELLDCLIENYQMPENSEEIKIDEGDVRLQQIFQYISNHFRTGISLADLADELYVSTSTLSRFFKKQTGIYFADYVNQMKCRYAIQNLLYTNNNITKIAVDAGFSNPSAFNKIFREIYGMTPSEYRKDKLVESRDFKMEQELREKLRQELKEKEHVLNPVIRKEDEITVQVLVKGGIPYEKNWNKAINIGSAYSLTIANVQYHTLYLAEHLGYRYIRLWSIFSKKLMLTDGKHIGNYNYDTLDGVLDFLVEHHLYPFLDFGKRPDAAIKSENQPVFFDSEYIEFESQEIWEAMFSDFVKHVVDRYGKEEVGHWIFEISYDRNHMGNSQYFKGEKFGYYDHFSVFRFAYQTVKAICPEAQVGGPGGIVDIHRVFQEDFLANCKAENIIPDFISFILFPYETHFENGQPVTYRANSRENELNQVKAMRSIVENSQLEGCRLFAVEWNNSVSSRNFLNDSCFRAAYVVKKAVDIWNQVDLLVPWTGSDWVSNYYDTRGISNGGNGILTKDSIRKPVYFALRFLNYLGDTEIQRGENYVITRKGNSFYILCFNYKWYSVNYFLQEEGMDSPEQIEDMFEDQKRVKLTFTLSQMSEGSRYVIKRRSVNGDQGSILDEWRKFQYDHQLSGADVKYIRESCFPAMSMERRAVQKGKLVIKTELQPHEIAVFHIYEDTR